MSALLLGVGIGLSALFGAPLFVILGLVALLAFAAADISAASVAIDMFRIAEEPMLIAIPLFTFAGYLFAESGTPRRIVRVSDSLLGWFPGGLGVVAP